MSTSSHDNHGEHQAEQDAQPAATGHEGMNHGGHEMTMQSDVTHPNSSS